MKVLAGDIGGTHARLATFRPGGERPEKVREHVWPSADFDALTPIVRAFLEEEVEDRDGPIRGACLGLAGPVHDGRCRLSNLDWDIRASELEEALGLQRVHLLNDFDAIGHGAPLLRKDELEALQDGDPSVGAPMALVGAGTGLGIGYLDPSVDPPRVFSSEGGHADFAPRDEADWALAGTLTNRYGRASRERVLSGEGLVDLYHHLAAEGAEEEDAELKRSLEETDEPAAVISRHGLEGDDPLCERALTRFVRSYGAIAGDVALDIGARGGLLVAGGIAPKILSALREGPFLDAFRDKGRLRDYMEAIPIHVILDEDVGIRGAASVALREVSERGGRA